MNLDENLRDKATSNGPFEDTSQLAQAFKFALRRGRNWEAIPPESKEALELISSYIARILTGDASEAKHWNGIAMLARLRAFGLEPPDPRIEAARIRAFEPPMPPPRPPRPLRPPSDDDA